MFLASKNATINLYRAFLRIAHVKQVIKTKKAKKSNVVFINDTKRKNKIHKREIDQLAVYSDVSALRPSSDWKSQGQ